MRKNFEISGVMGACNSWTLSYVKCNGSKLVNIIGN